MQKQSRVVLGHFWSLDTALWQPQTYNPRSSSSFLSSIFLPQSHPYLPARQLRQSLQIQMPELLLLSRTSTLIIHVTQQLPNFSI